MTLVFGYIRSSTKEEAQQGSNEAQKQKILEYAKANGYEVEIFEDVASGATTQRPSFERMFQEIPIKKPKLVVVSKIDRFARSLFDLLNSLKKLEENGVGFVSLGDPGVDTTSPNGRLLLQLLGAFAEFERNLIHERVRSGRERAKARGVRFGRPPLKTKSGVLNEKKVLEFYQKGVSIRSIARYFGCSTTPIRKILKAKGYVNRKEVLKLARKGINPNEIAKILGVSIEEVNRIIKGEQL